MAILELIAEHGTGLFYTLDGRDTVIGRLPECEIVLQSSRVSREHARISLSSSGFTIEDLGSRNGTLYNGTRIEEPRLLRNGDEIAVDESRFLFHADPPSRIGVESVGGVTGTIVFDPKTTLRPAANPDAQLKAVFALLRDLARAVSLDQIQVATLSTLFDVFPLVRRGFVLLPDAAGVLQLSTRRVNDDARRDPPTVGPVHHVCKECFSDKKSMLFVEDSSTLKLRDPDETEGIDEIGRRSIMCAPLRGTEDAVLGVVQIDRRGSDRPFDIDDLEMLTSIAAITGQATENNRLHAEHLRSQLRDRQLEMAAQVQRLLVPSEPPNIEGFEVFHHYAPAREVGGDFFDYLPLSDGRLAIAIGDVAGKDVSAALLMTRLSAAVRLCLEDETDLAAAVSRINRVVIERNELMRFVTFLVCVLDPRREEVNLVAAGHVPPVVRRADGRVSVVVSPTGGPPLGIKENPGYGTFGFSLQLGDAIFLCTDGIPEAHGDSQELYGMERLAKTLESPFDSAAAIGRGVLDDVTGFLGGKPLNDDVCVVTIRRTAAPQWPTLGFDG